MDQAITSLEVRFEQFQGFGCFRGEKFFKIKAHKKLSTLDYVSRSIEWFGIDIHRARTS
ncbi:PREDICTED: uncharacterized protein LOC109127938 [Camelina sativa]|uniref:Uncharacterized protein LOC109127938 n=1 Tax=Camelina sativa TaxID=90675 RepID=A0ABM1QQQ8_CAMSA|nr:PREDICTED: uncharacterized protein LOC109127938 [Camelina sativa]